MHKLLLVTLGFNITLLQTTLTESKLLLGPKVNSNQPTRSRNVLSTMGYQEATSPGPHLWNLQSEAMCPAPPHLVHTVVLVMLRVSELCQGLKILLSSSRRVPFKRANSRSCIFRRSFWSSGVSIPCFRMFLICSTAFFTFSMVLAVTRA